MDVRNVTIDPLAPASAVEAPTIREVIDLDTGKIVPVVGFIQSLRYEQVVKVRLDVRTRLARASPRYICAYCSTPAYLVANETKRFFFRHVVEDGSCPAVTRGELSQDEIRARKYDGLQESEPHKKLKALIARCLSADSTFSDIKTEVTWKSVSQPGQRRKPDVQAQHGALKLAFEVQLSTTFLDVVVARREFYRAEAGLVVWIMAALDPAYRRLTTDDLLFSNNSNILVADDETTLLSERTGTFHVRCFYRRPRLEGDVLAADWEDRVVPFSDLKIDQDNQRLFLFDHDGEQQRLLAELAVTQRDRNEKIDQILRDRFFSQWRQNGHLYQQRYEHEGAWSDMRGALVDHGVSLPPAAFDRKVTALINGVLSAQVGAPAGWNFNLLVEVGHYLAEQHKDLFLAFGFAIRQFGREGLLREQDQSRKWAKRIESVKIALRDREQVYLLDDAMMPLLRFLFPEIAGRMDRFMKKGP